MRQTLVTTLLLVAASVRPGTAQQLSLQQAVDRALARNPGIVAAAASVEEASGRVGQARSGYLPRVDLVESWHRGNQPVYAFGSLLNQRRFTEAEFAIDTLNHPDAITDHRAGIAVQQTLFDGLRTRSSVRAARIGREMAEAGVSRARSGIVLAVTETYGSVLLAAAGRRAAQAAVAAAEEDLRLAEHRRDAGIGAEADVLSLRVHLAEMRERQIRMASDEQVGLAALNRLMGDPLDTQHELVEVEPLANGTDAAADAASFEQQALRDRPEAKQSALAVALAEAEKQGAVSALIPVVALQGIYEFSGSRFDSRTSSWTIGAEARWSVFSGGANIARLREASAAKKRAEAERVDAEAGIRLEVRSAAARAAAARARAEVGQAAVAQAQESQRMIRDRYDAGMASVNDVLRAARALLDAEALRTGALVDVLVSTAALQKAIGVSR
ncbi:MAG: TolC family protein [Vicinamibacterales bacterium]